MRSRSAGGGNSADSLARDCDAHFDFGSGSFSSPHRGYASSNIRDSIVRRDSDGLRGIGRMGSPRAVARLTSMLNQVRQPIRVETHG